MLRPLLFCLLAGPAHADSALDALKRFVRHGGGELPAIGATVEAAAPRASLGRTQELFLDGKDIVRAESILGRSDGALGYRLFTKAGIFSATTDAATLQRLLELHRCAGVGGLKRRSSECRDVPTSVRIVVDRETKEITGVR